MFQPDQDKIVLVYLLEIVAYELQISLDDLELCLLI